MGFARAGVFAFDGDGPEVDHVSSTSSSTSSPSTSTSTSHSTWSGTCSLSCARTELELDPTTLAESRRQCREPGGRLLAGEGLGAADFDVRHWSAPFVRGFRTRPVGRQGVVRGVAVAVEPVGLLASAKASRSLASCSLDRLVEINEAPVDLNWSSTLSATSFDVITNSADVPGVTLSRTSG